MQKIRARGLNLSIENYDILTITIPKIIGIAGRKKYSDFFCLYLIKIAVQELSKTVFKIILAFPEAEICRFLMLQLAWKTLYVIRRMSKAPILADWLAKIRVKMGVWMKKWVTKVGYHVHSVVWDIYTSTSMIIKLCIVDYNILKYSSIFFADQISHLCSQKHAQLSRIQIDKAFF